MIPSLPRIVGGPCWWLAGVCAPGPACSPASRCRAAARVCAGAWTPPDRRRVMLPSIEEQLAAEGHCMANDDGDCAWKGCPQIADGEPRRSGRHCPRDTAWRAKHDPDDEGRAGNG